MPKITSVEPQLKFPNRFNIFIDGVFAFGADEDLVVEHRLIVGKEVSNDERERFLYEAEVGKLITRIYELLNRRPRSEKEIRDYLKQLSFKRKVKGKDEISQESIDLAIEKLKQKELINDNTFAKSWVEARKNTKKKGRIALKQELFAKGIDKDTVEEVLEDQLSSTEEIKLAKQALYRRAKRWLDLPLIEQKRKAMEYLLRQGFAYDLVKEVVEKMLGTEYNDL